MSLAPFKKYNSGHLLGCFTEAEHGNYFEYELNDPDDSWLSVVEYPHRVWVSQSPVNDSGWRYAYVKKTVAYIVVDEDDHGEPVVEKWSIKKHTAWY